MKTRSPLSRPPKLDALLNLPHSSLFGGTLVSVRPPAVCVSDIPDFVRRAYRVEPGSTSGGSSAVGSNNETGWELVCQHVQVIAMTHCIITEV